MEGVNSFEKGLHRTNSPVEQPEGSYVDALNWIRNDSGRLVNEELEIALGTAFPNHILLGYTPVNDLFICFFQVNGVNSEIGTFEKGVYNQIFNDINHNYKLDFKKEIDCVARVNNQSETVVYFVEEDKPARRFNLTTYKPTNSTYDALDDFNLQLTYKIPYCKLSVNDYTGGLASGVYSIVLRYRDEANNKTTCNIPTNFISITDDVAPTNLGKTFSDSIDGCAPETLTTKSIDITLKHVDTNYKFIEVIIITYIGLTNVLTIKSLGIYTNVENKVITFSSLLQLEDSVPIEEITENPIFYTSAKSIEQKDNILILSNLTSKKYDLEFQKIANSIELYWYIEPYNLYSPRAINSQFRTEPLTRSDIWDYRVKYESSALPQDAFSELPRGSVQNNVIDATDYWQSNIYQDPTIPKGFTRGEVYSFSITPIYKDGSLGFAYHIPAIKTSGRPLSNKRLREWVSSEDYPEYMKEFDINQNGKTTNKIQHHQMPDFDETGPLGKHNFDNTGNYIGSVINVLRVKAQNINFGILEPLLQGYIIGYQQRNSDINTRIIDYGYMRPYLKEETSNSYRNSFFTGNSYYRSVTTGVQSGKWSAQESFKAKSPYAQYYSVDSLYLNKPITPNYYIQEIGKGYNAVPNYAPASLSTKKSKLPLLISKLDTAAAQTNLYLFFEEGDSKIVYGPLKKINNATFVPNIYNTPGSTTTYLGDNQAIAIRQASRFWHIQIDTQAANGQNGAFTDTYIAPNSNSLSSILDRILSHDYRVEQIINETNIDIIKIKDNPNIRLARIVNPITFQYGTITNAEYIPSVVIFDDQNLNITGTNSVFLEGDTYVCKSFSRQWDLIHSGGNKAFSIENTPEWFDSYMLIGMYVETKNNLTLRYKESNGPEYYPKFRKIWGVNPANSGILNLPVNVDDFSYNKQYSALNNSKLSIAQPLFFTDIVKYPNRSVYSNQSFESENVDQYRIFPYTQFHDIPKDRGVITDTFVFNNNFFHHTEFGLWQSYFNPNTTQSTNQGDVVLGNAGIFKIPSKLIIDIKGGYMGTKDKSGTNTPFGRIFLDHHQGKVFLFAGEAPVEISDLGLFPFFREFVNTTDKYSIGYDWANKRLLISRIGNKAISFYPKTQTWTSLHDFVPTAYLSLNRETYAWQDSSAFFWNLTNPTGARKSSYITFVENNQPDAFKRFDRIEINTMSGGNTQGIFDPGSIVNAANYQFIDKSFTNIHCWTDRQNSTELVFAYPTDFNTNFLSNYNPAEVTVNYYRGSFHAEFPLDSVIDPTKNIFDNRPRPTGNLDINADFRAHMKAKFLYTKLSYKDMIDSNGNIIKADKPLVLNYVKTFFRPTVA
jgi:hypothetical protein